MARPPIQRTLGKDDVKGLDEPERLLYPLNGFMDEVRAGLAGGITTANLAAYVRTVEVMNQDTGTIDPLSPPPFAKPYAMVLGEKGKPFPGEVQEVRVLKVTRADGNLPGPVSVEGWQAGPVGEDGRRTLTLPRVNGLAPNVRYTLTLLIQAV